MYIRRGLEPYFTVKPRKNGPAASQRANQAPPRRRAVCTRAQGQFAHATTPGAPTIVVAQAKVARYKHICASEPENVCTLLAASPTKSASRHSTSVTLSAGQAAQDAARIPIIASRTSAAHALRPRPCGNCTSPNVITTAMPGVHRVRQTEPSSVSSSM